MPSENRMTDVDRAALREQIPGWGADLDPANRPSVPKEWSVDGLSEMPEAIERQPELRPRERSIEHPHLTPVFGTAQPLQGVSGSIRRFSYNRLSEGKASHWLVLMLADRVEMSGALLRSMLTRRPDNPLTDTGVLGEPHMRPVYSRVGRGRADMRHMWIDPILVAGPWLLGGWIALRVLRKIARRGSNSAPRKVSFVRSEKC